MVPRRFGAFPTVASAEVAAAAGKTLAVKRLPARDLDFELFRQGIDHRNADAVQTARGFIGAAVEFAARVKHRHDYFKRRFFWKFRVRIDRHAATVVEHAEKAGLLQRDLDEGGVSGDRLIHRVVDHLGEEVMQGVGVGSADKHAGAAANRLEPSSTSIEAAV